MARRLTPVLILLIGLPGAGKSTLAAQFCAERSVTCVNRDAIRAVRFGRRRVNAAQKRIANEIVWRRAGAQLRAGEDVLIDGMTFARATERRRARALARRSQARCVELFLACPPPLAQRRVLASREHPSADRTAALVWKVARRFDPVSRSAVRLDARAPMKVLSSRALAAIG